MPKHTIAVMGSTGNIGKVITKKLLAQGHTVRAIGRDPSKLAELSKLGAEAYKTEFDDAGSLAKAFAGVDAVFAMIPPDMTTGDYRGYQDRVGEAISRALTTAKVRRVVNLSSIGCHLSPNDKTGPVRGLSAQEQRLNRLNGISIVHLRPSFFMENLLWSAPVIRSTGLNMGMLSPDVSLPMIATQDIGEKAAEFLDGLHFEGQNVYELFGPQNISMRQVTEVLGQAIGKPDLQYKQAPYAEAEKGMVADGMTPDAAHLMVEMTRSLNEGAMKPTQQATSEHRGSTTINDFAKVFASVYKQSARAA